MVDIEDKTFLWVVFFLMVLFFLYAGEPDIHDAILQNLIKPKQLTEGE